MVDVKPVLVFDMDGVLVEVTESYREAIRQTVAHFTGQEVSHEEIQEYKNQGGWNNDWLLSHKICRDRNVTVEYETVVEYFQKIFFGENNDGLILREKWIPSNGLLNRLAERFHLAIFTGRLHDEALITLQRFCPDGLFGVVMAEDDVTQPKPSPEGLMLIAEKYPNAELYYVGDSPDDAASARNARIPFYGIAAPANPRRQELIAALQGEGTLAILENINQLESSLPK